jgi:hypothetical protein
MPAWFTRACTKKLEENACKNPDMIPYSNFWQHKLHEEVDELIIELSNMKPDPEKVLNEAADVANVAMLISRWHGGEAVDFRLRKEMELKRKESKK